MPGVSATLSPSMRATRIAIVGAGSLGHACERAAKDFPELELAGVVRRGGHVRDLRGIEVALVCVPAAATLAVAAELLQSRFAVVECAVLEGAALEAHHAEIVHLAARHRSRAVVGAGWDPGILTLLRRAFELLVPHGATELTRHPAFPLHHMAETIPGVRAALGFEQRAAGARQRYVYVELAPGARLEAVQAAIAADPAFAGEETRVFAIESAAALEAHGQGLLLERRGSAPHGGHPALLLEARFDPLVFAARAMLDAARRVPQLKTGGHRYQLSI